MNAIKSAVNTAQGIACKLEKLLSVSKSPEKAHSSHLIQSKEKTLRGWEGKARERGYWRKGRAEALSSNEYLVGVLLKSWLVCSSIIL